MICSSVNRERFISISSSDDGLYLKMEEKTGLRSLRWPTLPPLHNAPLARAYQCPLTWAVKSRLKRIRRSDLQGNNLKVGGETRPHGPTWAATPNPWKQEGTQSCEKRRVTKDLCGISLPQNPYPGFRSDHTELR